MSVSTEDAATDLSRLRALTDFTDTDERTLRGLTEHLDTLCGPVLD